MAHIVVDIPHVGASHSAREVYTAFSDLGWTHSMTSYMLQGAGQKTTSRVRMLSFQWTKPERPVYPAGISCRTIA